MGPASPEEEPRSSDGTVTCTFTIMAENSVAAMTELHAKVGALQTE
jgi:hypothetical protein